MIVEYYIKMEKKEMEKLENDLISLNDGFKKNFTGKFMYVKNKIPEKIRDKLNKFVPLDYLPHTDMIDNYEVSENNGIVYVKIDYNDSFLYFMEGYFGWISKITGEQFSRKKILKKSRRCMRDYGTIQQEIIDGETV